MDEQRLMLDSLMGIDRDACSEERDKRTGESFKDSKVCKSFLVGFCPNELFKNTKRELGPCQYIHNDHVLSEFEAHPDNEELTKKYERSLKSFLEDIVREAERWLERERRNQRKPTPDIDELLTQDDKEQIEKLHAAAADLIARSAVDAEEGNFAMSEQKTAQALQAKESAEALKKRRMQAYMRREEGGSICEICGIRTESGVDPTVDENGRSIGGYLRRPPPPHEDGRVHRGYIQVRAKIKDIEEKECLPRTKRGGGDRDKHDDRREISRRKSRERRDERKERDERRVDKREEEVQEEKPKEKKENYDGLPTMDDADRNEEDSAKKEEVKKDEGTHTKSRRRSHRRSRSRSNRRSHSRTRHRNSRSRRSRRRRSYGRRR